MTIWEGILYYTLTFLISGTLTNLPIIIFGIIGLVLAKKGKKPTWCFIVGTIIQLLIWVIYIVAVKGAVPNKQFSKEIVCMLYFVIFLSITITVAVRLYRKNQNTQSDGQ